MVIKKNVLQLKKQNNLFSVKLEKNTVFLLFSSTTLLKGKAGKSLVTFKLSLKIHRVI